ncbi:MAG: CAP domain-containing protein [Candidatus Aureabacteria bacterium]|nr:CAP domain-containing protein [Candidatus Auribacterota bacterium]
MNSKIKYPRPSFTHDLLYPVTILFLYLSFHGYADSDRSIIQPQTSELITLEQEIFSLINAHRSSANLPFLIMNPALVEEARHHSRAMSLSLTPFGHEGLKQRKKNISRLLPGNTIAENVAWANSSTRVAEKIVKGWLKSGRHRKNIEGCYQTTGIGAAKNFKGIYYITEIFWK